MSYSLLYFTLHQITRAVTELFYEISLANLLGNNLYPKKSNTVPKMITYAPLDDNLILKFSAYTRYLAYIYRQHRAIDNNLSI